MKTSILLVFLLLCAGMTARAQEASDPLAGTAAGQTLSEAASGAEPKQPQQTRSAPANTGRRATKAEPATSPLVAASVGGQTWVSQYGNRLQEVVQPGPGQGKSLVIRSSEVAPKEQVNLEEDLAVMSHILDKALDENLGRQSRARTAMGINLFFAPGSTPLRNIFLDGYGALFMLRVNFPLLAPPANAAEPKEERSTDSTWEDARRELQGPQFEEKAASAPGEDYDEEKVTRLKNSLLESLKNATNIRGLKAEDWITVCVFGDGNAGPPKFRNWGLSRSGKTQNSWNEPGEELYFKSLGDTGHGGGSILTIRVKKSDVDNYAKGKLNLEDFRKKAKITTYAGGAGGEGTGFVYGYSTRSSGAR